LGHHRGLARPPTQRRAGPAGAYTRAVDQTWLDELSELLRIPSISADPARSDDVRRAGEWVAEFVRAAGGEAEMVAGEKHPLAIGELRATSAPESAPTVIVYGHFDVQPPAPL